MRVNLGWKVSPFSSLWLLDLLRAARQSDAYTCLRLVIRESEVGSRDARSLWLAGWLAGAASFISRTQLRWCHIIHHSESDPHTLVYPNHSCFFSHHGYQVILYSLYESRFAVDNRSFCSERTEGQGSYFTGRSVSHTAPSLQPPTPCD